MNFGHLLETGKIIFLIFPKPPKRESYFRLIKSINQSFLLFNQLSCDQSKSCEIANFVRIQEKNYDVSYVMHCKLLSLILNFLKAADVVVFY